LRLYFHFGLYLCLPLYLYLHGIKNILAEDFDTDSLNDFETELYDAQNIVLRIFVYNIMDHTHHYLINGLSYVKDQYFSLQKYMDLGTHAQIYEVAKKLHIMKFNTVELTISAFNTLYNMSTDAGLIMIHELLFYIFLAVLTPHFGSAIYYILADTPQALQTIFWTFDTVGRYFL
jgi:hypothetical protein